jgi:hypothetical protein
LHICVIIVMNFEVTAGGAQRRGKGGRKKKELGF